MATGPIASAWELIGYIPRPLAVGIIIVALLLAAYMFLHRKK